MHILFICQTFPEPDNQRKGIFYRDQAVALQKAGHQVGVIALGGFDSMDLSREGLRNWQKQILYVDSGLPVYRSMRVPFPLKRRDTCLRLWSITTPATRTANLYMATHGVPDILHSQNFFYAGLAGIRIARANGLRHVLTEHSSLFIQDRLREDKLRLLREQLPKIHCSLAVSNALADHIRSYVPGKEIRVVGNIVDTKIFSPGKGKKPRYPFTYTIAAGLDRNKNVEVALRAFYQAFAGRENFRLVICGDGPEKENLAALAEKLNLNAQVDFFRFLPRRELLALYQRSHVIVSSSYSETFGLTLVEAMACGIPVIATRSGGPEDFVTGEVGLLVDTGNVEDMSKAMQKMYRSYNEYRPEKIRAHCVRNYSEQAFVKKLEKIYEEEKN